MENVSYVHTDAEWKLIPSNAVHLKKDDLLIHKDPRSFITRVRRKPFLNPKTGKQRRHPDTGAELNIVVTYPPGANLGAYLSDGWTLVTKEGKKLPKGQADAIVKKFPDKRTSKAFPGFGPVEEKPDVPAAEISATEIYANLEQAEADASRARAEALAATAGRDETVVERDAALAEIEKLKGELAKKSTFEKVREG